MAKKYFIVAAGRTLSLSAGVDKVAGDKVSLEAAEGESLVAAGFVIPAKGGKASSAKAEEEAAAKAKAEEEAAAKAKAEEEAAAKAKAEEEAAAKAKAEAEAAAKAKAAKSADLL